MISTQGRAFSVFLSRKTGPGFQTLGANPILKHESSTPSPPPLGGNEEDATKEMFCTATACHRKGPGRGTGESNRTVEMVNQNKRGLNSSAILKVQFRTLNRDTCGW